MHGIAHPVVGLALALVVGFVLGLLGGGGSILALPIFLYVFLVPVKPAIAMSLAVVGMSAAIGFLSHWRQGTVNLRIAVPFGLCAMSGAFVTARLARHVPEQLQLTLFGVFALSAAAMMLRDSLKPLGGGRAGGGAAGSASVVGGAGGVAEGGAQGGAEGDATSPAMSPALGLGVAPAIARFSLLLAAQAVGVGALTSLIGAGGGFVIVPALVLLARVPVREAVGSSLLIITMNALSGFVGYLGQVPINWRLVGSFTGVAAIGALGGTRMVRHIPQHRIKQGFAVMILVLGTYFALRKLGVLP
ncbi:MAG: sulfite exporter TauE/SafE family protein [Gemmatimonadaceae bacterium]|nr:sulfite exporter TauE/SafE family protein [Gemmatimonadaceae bacterium]